MMPVVDKRGPRKVSSYTGTFATQPQTLMLSQFPYSSMQTKGRLHTSEAWADSPLLLLLASIEMCALHSNVYRPYCP